MKNLVKLSTPEIEALLFQPPEGDHGICPANAEDVLFNIVPGVNLACRFYLSAPDAPTLIYYPCGRGSVDSFSQMAASFTATGVNVLLTSWRGFGESTGVPSLSVIFPDVLELFARSCNWLSAQGYTDKIFVMGRSLGSVAAIEVAHKNGDSVKGLILESAFCDTLPLLSAMGVHIPMGEVTEEDGFQNLQKIAAIKIPTILFHGARDVHVPVSQAEKLQAASAAKSKQFFMIPGAEHFAVSQTGGKLYFQTIKGFIDTVCGVNTWRQRRRKYQKDRDGDGI
jgi:uncharacterized protein